jgi:hypothetical protein
MLGLGRTVIATVQPVEILVAGAGHRSKVLARAVQGPFRKAAYPGVARVGDLASADILQELRARDSSPLQTERPSGV